MLVLGSQVLVGFNYNAFMRPGFERLQDAEKFTLVGALILLLATIAMLFAPAAYHRIALRGSENASLHRFATRAAEIALFPFAVGIGLSLYTVTAHALSPAMGIALGTIFTALALLLWYAAGASMRKPREWMAKMERERPKPGPVPLRLRIEHMLIETRVILPGVQTLLGFQLIAILSDAFDKLPQADQHIHLATLAALALSVLLLMAPAAYHRLSTEGDATDDVLQFGTIALLSAMVPLALALAADFYVILNKALHDPRTAATGGALCAALMLGGWFALPFALRRKRRR